MLRLPVAASFNISSSLDNFGYVAVRAKLRIATELKNCWDKMDYLFVINIIFRNAHSFIVLLIIIYYYKLIYNR